MSKIFRGALFGGFRRRDVVRYLETLDARQQEDLRRREAETEDARKQADAAYAELNAAREAAANLRAALAAQRSENARLSQRAGQLAQQQAALQETLRSAGEEQKKSAAAEGPEIKQLSQLCDRLDEALLRLDELMRDGRDLRTPADGAPDEEPAVEPSLAPKEPVTAAAPPRRSSLSELLDRVKPR